MEQEQEMRKPHWERKLQEQGNEAEKKKKSQKNKKNLYLTKSSLQSNQTPEKQLQTWVSTARSGGHLEKAAASLSSQRKWWGVHVIQVLQL